MIKIKVFQGEWMREQYSDGSSIGVCDHHYCVYLFGILIHSVRIERLTGKAAYQMFGKYLNNK